MSFFDDIAADAPVRDVPQSVPRLALDTSGAANARVRKDVLRMSRKELEDKFLTLNDENLNFKQHINKQDDKIKCLTTKLSLMKDHSRLEQLASGAVPHPGPRGRDVGMEELIKDLQDKIRTLHSENESLKQQLQVAKQQINQQKYRRASPYSHILSRINSGIKKHRDMPSPSPVRPKKGAGRPSTSQLPRYGHSLLEEARAKIRNLENVTESQRSHMEVQEGDAQLLRDELKKKEAEFEEREKAYVFKPNVGEEEETEEFSESLHLEPGENVLELQISNVSLSPSALQSLSDPEPYTFWAYTLHLCDLHSTTFVSGRCPRYSFTSRYVVRMDQAFLDCMIQSTVTVKMYQVPGLDQTTRRLASGQIRLQPLTEQEGKIHGTIPLIAASPRRLERALCHSSQLRQPQIPKLLPSQRLCGLSLVRLPGLPLRHRPRLHPPAVQRLQTLLCAHGPDPAPVPLLCSHAVLCVRRQRGADEHVPGESQGPAHLTGSGHSRHWSL